MMGRTIRLGRIAGILIELDYSWFIIFVLFLLSLSAGYFPQALPWARPTSRWLLGLVVTVIFFGCVVTHELSHALVARRHGIVTSRISLFVFGGVARIEEEPPSAGVEFQMAVAGPLASIGLGLGFWLAAAVLGSAGWLGLHKGAVFLRGINFLLAAFNLLPAFPLDGGRMLRALLWTLTHSLTQATRVATSSGQGLGFLLIAAGIYFVVSAQPLQGLWLAFIGWFLARAAQAAYQQLLARQSLAGVSASQVMRPQVVVVAPTLSLRELVDDYFLRFSQPFFPVVNAGQLEGTVSLAEVNGVARDRWDLTPVSQVAAPLRPEQVIPAAAQAWEALSRMATSGEGRLVVMDDGRLSGIIAREDLLGWVRVRLALRGR